MLSLNKLLSIDIREVTFARRGFSRARPEIRDRLEHVGSVFLVGYHAALQLDAPEALRERLERVELEYRGFAYEGAAMALTLCDAVLPRSTRFQEFMEGEGKRHIYMLHVGAGCLCISSGIFSFQGACRFCGESPLDGCAPRFLSRLGTQLVVRPWLRLS